ncbi:hypothetical protein [Nocardia sp. NPDC057353]|uniref:hypothetical protein n=1 Tax=Nocardia sp. NPDC057353 TaxID=3346104 RepID=UPI0036284116
MSDLVLDPGRARELADSVRRIGDSIRELNPLADGVEAEPTLQSAEIGRVVDATATALEKVITYHADRLLEFSDLTNRAVDNFLQQEAAGAAGIDGTVPR